MKQEWIELELSAWGLQLRVGALIIGQAWQECISDGRLLFYEEGLIKQEDAVCQDIKAVCARLDQQRPGLIWAKRPLILLWPWQNCLFRNLTLPPLPAKDRFQALRWTLEEAIALPAKDLACSWRLAQEPQTEKHIYGVAMTRCAELEHWTKLLRSAGLKVCHVDFALAWYGRR